MLQISQIDRGEVFLNRREKKHVNHHMVMGVFTSR